MHHVYILGSQQNSGLIYKGYTTDLPSRLLKHNSGEVLSTQHGRPWRILVSASFETVKIALAFEKYLKTGSGIAFMRKRLIVQTP